MCVLSVCVIMYVRIAKRYLTTLPNSCCCVPVVYITIFILLDLDSIFAVCAYQVFFSVFVVVVQVILSRFIGSVIEHLLNMIPITLCISFGITTVSLYGCILSVFLSRASYQLLRNRRSYQSVHCNHLLSSKLFISVCT